VRQRPRRLGTGARSSADMITEWELWVCANSYVSRHQKDAPVVAAMRCDELLEQGDMAGVRTFNGIIERIHELLAKSRGRQRLH
jgi:hypothetical protein